MGFMKMKLFNIFTLFECEEKVHAKSIFTVIYLHVRILSLKKKSCLDVKISK